MRRTHLVLVTAVAGLAVAACGDTTPTGSVAGQASQATIPAVPKCVQGSISADGSSAIKALIQKAAEAYQAQCAGATISVAATNSSTGVTKASSGAVDIGDSDVPAGLVKGVDPSTIVDHQVAIVLFTVAVNPATGVKNLTTQQIKDIFSGKTTNWKDVGGNDLPIAVIERKPGSGTRFTFDADIMQGTAETPSAAQVIDTTQTVVQALQQTPGGISYMTASSLPGSNLTGVSIDGNAPTAENISNGSYNFFSHEHCFTKPQPSQLALSFLQFVLSDSFQNGTLKSSGYLPLSTTTRLAAVDK